MIYSMLPYMIAAGIIVAVPMCICYVLYVIGTWKIFIKAGIPGWKSIIPYYNTYNLYKMSQMSQAFWIFLVANILSGLFHNMDGFLFSLLYLVCAIVCLVVDIKMSLNLAKSFGKGIGFGIILWMFPFIGILILGFGNAEYVGYSE